MFGAPIKDPETLYNFIPAQPGWWMLEWEGTKENPTITRIPIVAWRVTTELYKTKEGAGKYQREVQGVFDSAEPVQAGGADSDHCPIVTPENLVIHRNTGKNFASPAEYINWAWDQLDLEEAKSQAAREAKSK